MHICGILFSCHFFTERIKNAIIDRTDDLKMKRNTEDMNEMTQTNTTQINPLGTEPVGQLLRRFAVPSIVAMLVNALYNMVDQIFIGHSIGELGNAATNVAFPLTTSCTALALLFGIGAASAFNLSMGRGEKDKALYYIGNAAVMMFGSGIVLFLIAELFLDPMLILFGSPDNVLGLAREYVRIVAVGFPFLILTSGGAHLVRADGSPNYSMACNLTGALVNTILDPILIFGYFGLPAMGVAGAAVATVIGQIVAAVLAFIINQKKNKEIHLDFRAFKPDGKIIGTIYAVGIPSIIMQAIGSVMTYGMNRILMVFSSTAAAVFGVYFKLQSFIFMPVFGLNNGMVPIIAYNYGAGKKDRLTKTMKLSIMYAVAIMAVGIVVFQIFPSQLFMMFDASETMLAIGVPALRTISLSFAFSAAAASAKLFTWFCPLVPTLPQLICSSFSCCSTAQNLCDFSS